MSRRRANVMLSTPEPTGQTERAVIDAPAIDKDRIEEVHAANSTEETSQENRRTASVETIAGLVHGGRSGVKIIDIIATGRIDR